MLTLPMLLLSSCGITNAGGGAGSATGCGCSMESSPAYAVGDAGSEKGGPPGRGKGREMAWLGFCKFKSMQCKIYPARRRRLPTALAWGAVSTLHQSKGAIV